MEKWFKVSIEKTDHKGWKCELLFDSKNPTKEF